MSPRDARSRGGVPRGARRIAGRYAPRQAARHAAPRAAHPAGAQVGQRPFLATLSTRASLWAVIGALCVFGLVMVMSASSVISIAQDGGPWTVFKYQVAYEAGGVLAMWWLSRRDYHKIGPRTRVVVPAIAIALLVLVRLPGVGKSAWGSSRWLVVGPFHFQPSELAKLALIVFIAELLARRFESGWDPSRMVGPVLVVFAVLGGLVALQPDLGTTIVLAAITLGMLYAAGVPLMRLLKVTFLVAGSGLLLAMIVPGRSQRLTSFLHPFAQAKGAGYQVVQSLVGIGSGGLFGLGLGNSRQKWGLLPNAHTDFIFSVIGEELGLIGTLAVLATFVVLAWLGLRTAACAPDRFGRFLAVGVTWWLVMQAAINIGATIDMLPVTGIPLPFISYGGSSLVIDMVAAGVLLNVAGQERSGTRRAGAAGVRR